MNWLLWIPWIAQTANTWEQGIPVNCGFRHEHLLSGVLTRTTCLRPPLILVPTSRWLVTTSYLWSWWNPVTVWVFPFNLLFSINWVAFVEYTRLLLIFSTACFLLSKNILHICRRSPQWWTLPAILVPLWKHYWATRGHLLSSCPTDAIRHVQEPITRDVVLNHLLSPATTGVPLD